MTRLFFDWLARNSVVKLCRCFQKLVLLNVVIKENDCKFRSLLLILSFLWFIDAFCLLVDFVFSLMVYAFFGGFVDVKASVTETAVKGDSIVTHEATPGIHNLSKCRVWLEGSAMFGLLLVGFSGVALSCFTLSRSTVFMALSLKQKGRLVHNSVLQVVIYSVSVVRKPMDNCYTVCLECFPLQL